MSETEILNISRDFAEPLRQEMLENPYLQSKRLWNDLYGDVQTRLENAYRIIFILATVIAVSILGFIVVASEVKVKALPFIIHGDEVLTVNPENSPAQFPASQLAGYFSKNFIRNARSITTDAQVNRNQEISAYSFVSGEASQVLKDFYQKNNPADLALHQVKSVQITSLLRTSKNSFALRWEEETRKADTGDLVQTQHFIAQIHYQYLKPSEDALVLRSNPMGFQITELSWSEDLQA